MVPGYIASDYLGLTNKLWLCLFYWLFTCAVDANYNPHKKLIHGIAGVQKSSSKSSSILIFQRLALCCNHMDLKINKYYPKI